METSSIALYQSPVRFDEDKHEYWLGDKQLSGITGIIKAMCFPDEYKDVPPEVLKKAAERGSAVHKDIELIDECPLLQPLTEEGKNYQKLKEKYGLVTLANEYVVSDECRIASCIDLVFEGGILGDIKTVSKLNTEYVSWQLSIYAWLFERQNPDIKINRLVAIHLRGKIARVIDVERKPTEVVEKLISDYFSGLIPEQTETISDVPAEILSAREQLISLLQQQKEIESQVSDFKSRMLTLMEEQGVLKWEMEGLKVAYVAPTTKETFDSKSFRADNEELYNQYVKTSQVKSSIRITLAK